MKTIFRLFLFALALTTLLSACQTPAPTRVSTLDEFFAPPSDKVFSTADSIVVRGVRTNYINNFMRADFKIFNNRGRRNVVNYRVQWYDRGGMITAATDSWLTTALEGQQEIIVTVVSPSDRAVDYRFELQSN
ncbi:MAG: YcfL family protein [Desulfuromonadales bacterium]